MTTPFFPPAAKRAHVTGLVTVEAVIGKDGKVVEAHAVSGPSVFRWIAEDAFRRWRYEPTLLDGQPVERVAQVDFCFCRHR
jgi:protein TonB